MWRQWSALSREQKKVWTLVSGAIVFGTVFKVRTVCQCSGVMCFFFVRILFVD